MLRSLLARLRPGAGVPRQMPAGLLKGLLPIAVLAIIVTALVLAFMWREQASYKPIFGAREKVSASDMMSVLDAAGIAYRIHPESGQVLVPDSRLGEVRMLLASKGVVAKLPAGLELMDTKDPLGVSQFVQDVRFRRGLEGELTQSIMTLDAIESARVHLSIAKSSSFVVSGGEKGSASVVLVLKPGHELQDEQIAAIINMVANSAVGIDPAHVTLVDQAGRFLSARVDLSEGFEAGQGNEAAHRYQEETRKNAQDLLAPVLGAGNFRVSTTADVDNDRVSETQEQYGDTPKVTNEAVRAETDRDPLALGVPGSLSNRPVAVAAAATPAKPEDGANSAQKNASTRQYAYDRNIKQIQRSRGRLRKLSVAVVLNNSAAPGGASSWSAEQIANIDRILRSGLGIDATRGDSLVVSALAFPKPEAVQPWWQQRDNIVDFTSWLSYALMALFTFLLVVRPLMSVAKQRLALPAPGPIRVEATVAAAAAVAGAGAEGALPQVGQAKKAIPVGPLLEDYDLPPAGSPVDVMVDHLKVLAAKEPERVAEVVKQWVQKNVRTE
ncbi:MAG TPA: flagellar basal-body MS-ring/collar protein FliF [Steroidobacteraceae bacterium]